MTKLDRQMQLALRDLMIEALELPPDEEASSDTQEALLVGLLDVLKRGGEIISRRPRSLPRVRPAVLALMPPADGAPCWVIFRSMPPQAKNVDITSAKAGYPVRPLNLNADGKTYKIHVGNSFIPADAFDGAVPDELAEAYSSGAIVLHPPGTPAPSEPLLLLWSRARSIANEINAQSDSSLSHADAAVARPQVVAELQRIAARMPPGSGAMHESVTKLATMFAPPAPFKGEKNVSVGEQKRAQARNRAAGAAAKRAALIAGELPADAELAQALATAPQDLTLNSFGRVAT